MPVAKADKAEQAPVEGDTQNVDERDVKRSAAETIIGVMRAIEAVGKTGRNSQQGYNFRGIDAVINAVGPELRKLGGFITPNLVSIESEHGVTKNGSPNKEVTVTVRFDWYGSDGGSPITATVAAEANDTSDKATAKAMSVAYRTYLIQILCLPTDEPDPDESYDERGTVQQAKSAGRAPQQRQAAPARQQSPQQKFNAVKAKIAAFYSGLSRSDIAESVEFDSGITMAQHTLSTLEEFLSKLESGEVEPSTPPAALEEPIDPSQIHEGETQF